jgi:CSLREA domain-containing protein
VAVTAALLVVFVPREALSPPPAQAANIVVTNADDSGAGSLRQAILDANGNGQDDTITFDPNFNGGQFDIVLSSPPPDGLGQLEVGADNGNALTIDGEENNVTIDGNDVTRILFVNSGADLSLINVTVSNGDANIGGGMLNDGTLSLTGSTVSDNTADDGGGIFNTGTLTVTSSRLSDNQATGSNNGGGIYNQGGTVDIVDSTIIGNSAGFNGGGVFNEGSLSTVTVNDSTVSGNNVSNSGGGIANQGNRLTVVNSTVSGNSAHSGGGVFHSLETGTVSLINSTVTTNTAASGNGGVFVNNGTLTAVNTIIAAQTAGGDCAGSGTIASDGHNLESGTSCGFGGTGDIQNVVDADIEPLANNGGPTETHALGQDSPAIDAGDDAVCADEPVNNLDQRGEPRPLNGDGAGTAICDIGAFELEQPEGLVYVVNSAADIDDFVPDGTCDTGFLVGDDLECTLRAAIQEANGDTQPSRILFDPAINGGVYDIVLTNNQLLVSADGGKIMTIDAESNDVTIDGNNTTRVLFVASGANVTLANLTITNGFVSAGNNGGGIQNDGALNLTSSVVSGNRADNGGGIINNGGGLTITNSTIDGNSAAANFGRGAGIYNNGGTVNLTNSTVRNNGPADGNLVRGSGAYNGPNSQLTLTNSTVSGNTAHEGAGIYNDSLAGNGGTVNLINSTISDNTATSAGGGLLNFSGATVELTNTIIAAQAGGGDCAHSGGIDSNGHNLESGTSCSLTEGTDIQNGTADLEPLADNGGPTQTHALGENSDATDAGDDTVCADEPIDNLDQRGESRPEDGNGDNEAHCDIGAFELQPTVPLCFGEEATIFNQPSPINGTAGDDVIVGNATADVIDGGEGDDLICALGGNDSIIGGLGADMIDGGAKADRVSYPEADGITVDLAQGTASDGDTLVSVRNVRGSEGADTITGSSARNHLEGLGSNDTISGGNKRDKIHGGSHNDDLFGEDGDDKLIGGKGGDDSCDGGSGTDSSRACETVAGIP